MVQGFEGLDGLGREAAQLELGLRPVEPLAVAGGGMAGAAVEEAPEDAPAAVRSAFLIRETPADESPRERLLCGGARALTDVELLAVLVQNGGSAEAALAGARELDRALGGLIGLKQAGLSTLWRQGLGEERAAAVLAAVELARRLARAELPPRLPMARPEEVAQYLALRYARTDQEIMGAMFLDTRNRLITERAFFRGTLSRAAAEPRPILKEAMALDAGGVLLFHTHPSGDPDPSHEDVLFTRRMAKAGELVGVNLVDHMIVTPSGRWASVRRRGGW